jgi:hypothetical protein
VTTGKDFGAHQNRRGKRVFGPYAGMLGQSAQRTVHELTIQSHMLAVGEVPQ